MNEIILTCCGEIVPPSGEAISCPACRTQFTEGQLEQLTQQEFSRIPVVDLPRAAKMLNQPAATISEQRQLLEPMCGKLGLDFVFPITAIRRFATERNLTITPRSVENGVLWIDKLPQKS